MVSTTWGGHKVTKARAYIASRLPLSCTICHTTVNPGDAFVVAHIQPRWSHPELTWVPSNWGADHKTCSNKSGQSEVIKKARAKGRADYEAEWGVPKGSEAYPPPRPVSLQSHDASTTHQPEGGVIPGQTPARQSPPLGSSLPVTPREDLRWTEDTLANTPWLTCLLPIPADAAPPLWMSPVSPEATGSYGTQAIEWIETEQKITLRWWQRLAILRQLEHRADGSLVHREVLESCPRRAGKSVRIRGLALWRMEHGESLFGEVQTIVHTGSDVAICREIQRGAWRWADGHGWVVTKANGKEAVESNDGDRWLVRSQDGVYGYDVCMGIVDEGWNVKPDTVSEGLEPATLERLSPQLHLTSTAHRRATSLLKSRLLSALTVQDPSVLLLVWAAPHGSDPSDPDVWRAASPHWSEDRRRMIASKYEKAVAGEVDPQADDLDPVSGFTAQYLNIWPLNSHTRERGEPVIHIEDWDALEVDPITDVPQAAAIESWFGPTSLALAWRDEGRVVVSTSDHPDLASAMERCKESGYTGTVIVGSSLSTDPAFKGVRVKKGEGRTAASVEGLQRLMADDVLRHDGDSHLTEQIMALRTTASADGVRMTSTERADAVKAAIWAAEASRVRVGALRILLPR